MLVSCYLLNNTCADSRSLHVVVLTARAFQVTSSKKYLNECEKFLNECRAKCHEVRFFSSRVFFLSFSRLRQPYQHSEIPIQRLGIEHSLILVSSFLTGNRIYSCCASEQTVFSVLSHPTSGFLVSRPGMDWHLTLV